MHEACYADGVATRWSAERVMPPEYAATPELLTGEHVYPWMFEDYGALAPLREAAELLAAHEWPRLYDPDVLRANEVPVAAAIYADDPYVERAFSEETAALIRGAAPVGHQRVRAQRPARGRRPDPRPADRPRARARLTVQAASTSVARWPWSTPSTRTAVPSALSVRSRRISWYAGDSYQAVARSRSGNSITIMSPGSSPSRTSTGPPWTMRRPPQGSSVARSASSYWTFFGPTRTEGRWAMAYAFMGATLRPRATVEIDDLGGNRPYSGGRPGVMSPDS